MHVYKLIEQGIIEDIEFLNGEHDDLKHISFLTILDCIQHDKALIGMLSDHHAILDYDSLLDISSCNTRKHLSRLREGIDLLLIKWKTRELQNESLKEKLDQLACKNLVRYWRGKSTTVKDNLFNIIDRQLNNNISNMMHSWLNDTLDKNLQHQLDVIAALALARNLKKKGGSDLDGLLRVTYRAHKNQAVIEMYFKSIDLGNYTSLLDQNIISITNDETILLRWRNGEISPENSQELEKKLLKLISMQSLPKNISKKVTEYTITSILKKMKQHQLDQILSSYLEKIFVQAIQEASLMNTIVHQTAREILSNWKKSEMPINTSFPLENLLLPELNRTKVLCETKLSGGNQQNVKLTQRATHNHTVASTQRYRMLSHANPA